MPPPANSPDASPWHAGEIAMQRTVGVAERMADVGRRVIRNHLIDQHRQFYPLLPFVALGAVDAQGDAWATLRAGAPGFLHSPDPQVLHAALARYEADPADSGMEDGKAIALLGIELQTRRRNRLNGTIRRGAGEGFDIQVQQSYGNCPQYIQLRDYRFAREPAAPASAPPQELQSLDPRARALITGADTFFVATYVDGENGTRQVDVSHRGGKAGFVRLGEDGVLTIPDFAGNLFFNTLGNLLLNPRAGLVFVDFASGDLLQLSGTAEVLTDSPEIAAFQGAERLWRFTPRRIVYRADALPLRWAFEQAGWSPNSLMTGDWAQAAERLKAAQLASAWRPFRIAQIVDESAGIRSFQLEPTDGAGLIPHAAGQHLPIRLTLPGAPAPVLRTYTLSTAPSDGIYRISVKREGRASRHLHSLRAGDLVEARAPAGAFTIDAAERRPAVLLAAGIGITPILSMLRHLVYEGLRTRRVRPTWVFYAARTAAERAFERELSVLVDRAAGAVTLVRVLSQTDGATQGRDYEAAGRIDMALLKKNLPFDDYDFYLCGPPSFMQGSYEGLRGLHIADARIHAEAFGPAGIQRTADAGAPAVDLGTPAQQPVPVAFLKSAKEARWTPGGGSLLELAEARGLAPEFSCRGGSCGSCRTRLLAGAVAYTKAPTAEIGPDEVLICCAVPAAGPDGRNSVQLDL